MSDKFVSINEFSAMPDHLKCIPEVLENVTTDDLKTLLDEYTLTPMILNAIIIELKKREPDFEHDDVPEIEGSEEDKEYPALSFIAGIFKLVGWLYIIGGFVGSVYVFSSDSNVSVGVGILVIVVALFSALLSFACAELILVITDISSSAYRILKKLQDNK